MPKDRRRRLEPLAGAPPRVDAPDLRIVSDDVWAAAEARHRCAACGGSLVAVTRSYGKRRAKFYGCSYRHAGGAAVCRNCVEIRHEILDCEIIDALGEALDDRVVEAVPREPE